MLARREEQIDAPFVLPVLKNYILNSDCTGTAQFTDNLGRNGTRAFVIVQDGTEIV